FRFACLPLCFFIFDYRLLIHNKWYQSQVEDDEEDEEKEKKGVSITVEIVMNVIITPKGRLVIRNVVKGLKKVALQLLSDTCYYQSPSLPGIGSIRVYGKCLDDEMISSMVISETGTLCKLLNLILAGSLTNSLDTRNHAKIHTTFPSDQPCQPYLCINKLAPSVRPSTRGYSEEERVMANTTPLVTTVMKPTSNPGEANTAPRVNIQELCEEYYEDILPIIMKKARNERLKDVHARLDFEEGPQEGTKENSRYSNTRAKNTEPER
nr:hypothetical protein [Tanacetum cinerariifolium]